MKIGHVAMWTRDLEGMRAFYEKYFQAMAGKKYHNPDHGFSSYFLSFADGVRLEIMHMPGIRETGGGENDQFMGLVHLAFSTGGKERVDELTARLEAAGYQILDHPRTTGDGYYESVVLDPEGNRIEITV